MRKDHDISGPELQKLSGSQLDDGPAFHDQVVQDQMFRSWSNPCRQNVRRRLRNTPRSRELRIEEYGAVQLDPAQDLRERVHSILWTICKVRRASGKVIHV